MRSSPLNFHTYFVRLTLYARSKRISEFRGVTFHGSKKFHGLFKILLRDAGTFAFFAFRTFQFISEAAHGRMRWQANTSSGQKGCPNRGVSNVIIVADLVDANST